MEFLIPNKPKISQIITYDIFVLQSSINWQQDQNTLGLIIIINSVSGSTALVCLRLKAKSERLPFTISKLPMTIIGNNEPMFIQIDLVIMGNNDAIITWNSWIINNNNKLVKIRPSNFFPLAFYHFYPCHDNVSPNYYNFSPSFLS